jgi:hypothetical protein
MEARDVLSVSGMQNSAASRVDQRGGEEGRKLAFVRPEHIGQRHLRGIGMQALLQQAVGQATPGAATAGGEYPQEIGRQLEGMAVIRMGTSSRRGRSICPMAKDQGWEDSIASRTEE